MESWRKSLDSALKKSGKLRTASDLENYKRKLASVAALAPKTAFDVDRAGPLLALVRALEAKVQ
jgi:hypothetical protein